MLTGEAIYEAIKTQTSKKAYKIRAEKSDNLTIFDSKFGGLPYWDFSQEFPKDNEGGQLNLLAQINFDKEEFINDDLPKKGILQFFIATNNAWYGMNYKEPDKQTNFRVIYHENVDYKINEDKVVNSGINTFKDACNVPFKDTYKITFEETESVINWGNIGFNVVVSKVLQETFNIIIEPKETYDYLEEIDEDFCEKFNVGGHKLLGYPCFAQYDPRVYGKGYEKYDTLLLQINSENGIRWGDSGIANFFINKNDLKNKNFNNILYNWDCY